MVGTLRVLDDMGVIGIFGQLKTTFLGKVARLEDSGEG